MSKDLVEGDPGCFQSCKFWILEQAAFDPEKIAKIIGSWIKQKRWSRKWYLKNIPLQVLSQVLSLGKGVVSFFAHLQKISKDTSANVTQKGILCASWPGSLWSLHNTLRGQAPQVNMPTSQHPTKFSNGRHGGVESNLRCVAWTHSYSYTSPTYHQLTNTSQPNKKIHQESLELKMSSDMPDWASIHWNLTHLELLRDLPHCEPCILQWSWQPQANPWFQAWHVVNNPLFWEKGDGTSSFHWILT